METPALPHTLKDLPLIEPNISATQGYSGVEVYYFPTRSAYLKIGPVGLISDLARERDILNWLNGRFPVASVLGYEHYEDDEALFITQVSGIPGSDLISSPVATIEEIESFAVNAAASLRRLHELPTEGCPFDLRLEARFARSRKSIELGLLYETDEEFEAEHDGMTAHRVYADLVQRRPEAEDLVFTHGDPCMPNIICDGSDITGFIDLDGAGVADRYVDIAIFFRSFHRNSRAKIDLDTLFCRGYGIDNLDQRKMEYYALLDDLF